MTLLPIAQAAQVPAKQTVHRSDRRIVVLLPIARAAQVPTNQTVYRRLLTITGTPPATLYMIL